MASIQLSRYEAEEGDLPDVCMCCGAPAGERKRLRFTSYPLWVIPRLMWDCFNANPLWLGFSLLWDWRSNTKVVDRNTRYTRCYTLFCSRHKNYWLIRSLTIWIALAVILVLIAGGFFLSLLLTDLVDESSWGLIFGSYCIGTFVILFCWLISIPISQATAIHPANVKDNYLILKRVSPAFADAVRRYREERKLQSQLEDYQEHFQPRRSRPHCEEGDQDCIERG